MDLETAVLSPLQPLGRTLERVDEGWEILKNGLGAFWDWFTDINRLRILRFARERFPVEFGLLDGGDKRIMVSFVDPDPISNTVSLLGADPRTLLVAPLYSLGAPASMLRKLSPDLDTEFCLDLRSVIDLAKDTLGTMAECDTPFVMEQEGARDGAERWFFINGIATSRELARRNADRLRALLNRPFITIHNPTQGLATDLTESALQKFTNLNTEPVAAAFIAIAQALADPDVERVAVVAHSQGTIISGDVLDLIYYALDPAGKRYLDRTNMNSEDLAKFLSVSHGTIKSDDLRNAVKSLEGQEKTVLEQLELYMFANAASRMCHLDPEQGRPVIESFANEHDLVARLGCLAEDAFHEEDLIRIDGPVFIRRGQYGHLLNAHYLSGDPRGAYQLLRSSAATVSNGGGRPPCVGRSLHDAVRGNPCASNPKVKPAAGMTSRLLAMMP